MYGIDISNWQGGINLDSNRYDFAIIKATEGLNYVDEEFPNFSVQLTKLNKLIGCYHYARPDLRPTIEGMEQEADWFIQTVSEYGLLYKSILVLDWEQSGFVNRKDLANAFISRIKEKTGIDCILYSSVSVLHEIFYSSQYITWVADWGYNNSYLVGQAPAAGTAPSNLSNWKIWQYTSKGLYPDYNFDIDLDYTPLTKDEWYTLSGENRSEKEIITPEMQWAIDNNLYQGYPDGKYKPKQYVTREELATVMKRFYDKFIK